MELTHNMYYIIT